jgi:hypothetical protein
MKTICRLPNHYAPSISIYLFEDDEEVVIGPHSTRIGPEENPDLIILDVNDSNAVLYDNVPEPSGYHGWKYQYSPAEGWRVYEEWPQLERAIRDSGGDLG